MQKHITSFTADRITVEILAFLEQKFPVIHAIVTMFATWIPKQDAYTQVRYRDNVFYTKLNGNEYGIVVQRAFVVNGDVIAIVTFRNKLLDPAALKNQPNENMQAILLSATPQASDDNLISALGDGTGWYLGAVVESLSTSAYGIDAEYITSSPLNDGQIAASFFIHSRLGSKCVMDVEIANPRFVRSFAINVLANIPKELYR